MDAFTALKMAESLCGKEIGGWNLQRFINYGKTGVVFAGSKEGIIAAVKIYDKETSERFGKDEQVARISRILTLKGFHHENLIQIFDGGECSSSGYLFLAMELLEAPNLKECLTLVPREQIPNILYQVSSAARFLEEKELFHGDIKPENIIILPDFSRAVLLDLCVLRPIGNPGFNKVDEKTFLGTLRYSSPEYLRRQEECSIEGFRAVTFYQLGAVLHDMLMRQPLFHKYSEPYAILVEAVLNLQPDLYCVDISHDLILLCQNCLVKSPIGRLQLVKWSDFDIEEKTSASIDAKKRVIKRALQQEADTGDFFSRELPFTKVAEITLWHLDAIIRAECGGNKFFPRFKIVHIPDELSIKVIFSPTTHLHLPFEVEIVFACKFVHAVSDAIVVTAFSCVLPPAVPANTVPVLYEVFRGPIDSKHLDDSIRAFLWSSIDSAQHESQRPMIEIASISLEIPGWDKL